MYESGHTGVGNQGMMLVCLYSLVGITQRTNIKEKVNNWINEHKKETEIDTYPSGRYAEDLKHIYHLRNAVLHGNVEFDDTNYENVIEFM